MARFSTDRDADPPQSSRHGYHSERIRRSRRLRYDGRIGLVALFHERARSDRGAVHVLLAGCARQDHVAFELHTAGLKRLERHRLRYDRAFHVARTATVDAAVIYLAAERVVRLPVLGQPGGNGIDVAVMQERLAAAATFPDGGDIAAAFDNLPLADFQPHSVVNALQEFARPGLSANLRVEVNARIPGVHAPDLNQLACRLDDLVLHRIDLRKDLLLQRSHPARPSNL